MSRQAKVLILGAGVAGLTAGLMLLRKGYRVTILEKEPEVGGLCRTVEKDGYRFDLGGHRFHTEIENVQHFIESLPALSMQSKARKSSILLDGRMYTYPLQIGEVLRHFPLTVSARSLVDFTQTRLSQRNREVPKRLDEWLLARFGKTLYEIFFEPYTMKLWGRHPAEISADWAGQRIPGISLFAAIRHMLTPLGRQPRSFITTFAYPETGINEIPKAMAREITNLGGAIYTETTVEHIFHEDHRVKEVTCLEEKTFQAFDLLISTMPITDIVRTFQPTLDEQVVQASGALDFRAIRLLFLGCTGDGLTDNQWIYVPHHHVQFFRIQETCNWSRALAPPDGFGLTLEYACDKGDALYNLDSDTLTKNALSDVETLGFDLRDRMIAAMDIRIDHAYPIYDLNYKQKLKTIFSAFGKFDNLSTIGRQGSFRYNNLDHSIKMGLDLSKSIVDNQFSR